MFSKRLISLVKVALFLTGLVYVLLRVIGWGMSFVPEDKSEITIKSFPSPDGSYIADIYERSGGGGISPFCYDIVAIHAKGTHLEAYEDYDKYQVYVSECDYFRGSASPRISWSGNRLVDVIFATNSSRTIPRKITIRPVDISGQVNVRFASSLDL